jgi:hypothetical protein
MDRSCGSTWRTKEVEMKATVVRYTTHPDRSDENAELVAAVFAELAARAPDGVRYACIRIGDEFNHIVIDHEEVIPSLDAFQRFASEVGERAVDAPVSHEASLVGAYGF